LRYVAAGGDPLEAPHGHYVLLELASADPGRASRAVLERVLEAALAAGEITDAAIAESLAQRDALWRLRERVPDYIAAAQRELDAIAPHRRSVFGHIGDGNLHFNLLPPEGERFAAETAAALTACVHETAARFGGSFSAEHGIGILKKAELARYKSPQALALMRTLKRAFDPNGIMNPGKVLTE
jgi:FAD/FMN-containing dehydrogenase